MMWWTKFHLKKPLSSIILYSIIMLGGIFSITGLRFTLSGEVYSPVISIKTQYFGMNSVYIEKNITVPIENAVSSIKGVKNISSVSEDGQSVVILTMNPGRPVNIATLEIKSSVDTVREKFPGDVQEPVISHYDPSQLPVMILSFYSDSIPLKDVRREVEEKIKPSMQKVDGVVECVVTGGEQSEVGVFVNTGALYGSGLQLRDISRDIQLNNNSVYLGFLDKSGYDMPVYSAGKYESLYEIDKIAVQESVSNVSYFQQLGKVAGVENFHKRIDDISRINGKERVSLYIQKKSDGNILKICGDIRNILKDINLKDVSSEIDFDKSEEISESLGNLIFSISLGMALLFIIMLIFIGDYSLSLMAVIPLPISIGVILIIANVFRIELNSIIMSGIALGSGLLVGDGIIIIEFLSKKKPYDINGHILRNVKLLFPPLTAALLTTICVFLPIIFSTPEIRALYTGFSIVITILLIVSLLLSTGIVPVAYKLRGTAGKKNKRSVMNKAILLIEHGYIKFLKSAMKYRKIVLGLVIFITLFSAAAFFLRGKSMAASDLVKEVYAYIEPSTGTSLYETDILARQAEEIFIKQDEIKRVITKVEKAHAAIILKLKREFTEKELERLLGTWKAGLSAVNSFIYFTYGEAENNNREINLMFIGDDIERIKEISREAARIIYTMPYFSEVLLRYKDDSPVYILKPDTERIQLAGLTLKDISDEARIFLYGIISSKLNPENSGIMDIRVASVLSRDGKAGMDDFLNIMIRNRYGVLIPLRELFTVTKGTASSKIYRYNKRRNLSITARLKAGYDLGLGLSSINKELSSLKMPAGYYWQFDEKYEKFSQSTTSMMLAVIAAIYLTFVTLVICYENIAKSILTLLVIPLSFPGIALIFSFAGISLSTPVYIGVIILAGITVKNSVLLLSNMGSRDNPVKVFHSCRKRLNSIYLTTLTSVIGLIPLIFTGGGGQYIWKPFAVTVVAGLLSSTLLCLVTVPLIAAGKIPPKENAGIQGKEK